VETNHLCKLCKLRLVPSDLNMTAVERGGNNMHKTARQGLCLPCFFANPLHLTPVPSPAPAHTPYSRDTIPLVATAPFLRCRALLPPPPPHPSQTPCLSATTPGLFQRTLIPSRDPSSQRPCMPRPRNPAPSPRFSRPNAAVDRHLTPLSTAPGVSAGRHTVLQGLGGQRLPVHARLAVRGAVQPG
jgi:hypothetical protein